MAVQGEGFRTRAAKLAAAATALNSQNRGAGAPFRLAFLTDRERGPDPVLVARSLPPGAAIILRDYAQPRRAALAAQLSAAARRRGLVFMVGGDPLLARTVGANGVHLRANQLAAPPECSGLLISAACHNADELALAAALGADLALLSPVFPTSSHPGAECLGPDRFCELAAAAAVPVLALGGVDETNARRLVGPNVAGIAAIGAFAPRH